MDALKRSMRWDEEVFGREYDLDVFNIVAVSDFNMGAMENKGLNIFNDKYVLAEPETATDADYADIEAIIAHEYFHNWTGNRITCRDWFQLCLKEGLTVFRDQEFSADMRSRPVKRIEDVRTLRARSSPRTPARSPIRCGPTAISRDQQLLHRDRLQEGRRGHPHDARRCSATTTSGAAWTSISSATTATAATIEDFLAAFADAAGRDLSHFARWYAQAGTPRVAVTGHTTRRRAPIASTSPRRRRRRRASREGADGDPGRARSRRGGRHADVAALRAASPARACSCSTAPPTASLSMRGDLFHDRRGSLLEGHLPG